MNSLWEDLEARLPEEALTPRKRRHLLRTAWMYLATNGLLDSDWRVDLIAIEITRGGAIGRVDHYQSVVDDDPDVRK